MALPRGTLAAMSGVATATDRESLAAAIEAPLAEVGVDAYVVARFHDGGAALEVVSAWRRGRPPPVAPGARFLRETYPGIDLLAPGEPLVCEDIAADPRTDEITRRAFEGTEVRAAARFSLFRAGEPFGVFMAGRCAAESFAPEMVEQLAHVGHLAAVALASMEGSEALARKMRQMHALYRAGEELAALSDEDTLIETAARLLVEDVGYVDCWIGMVDTARNLVRTGAKHGRTGAIGREIEISLDDHENGLIAVIRAGRPAAQNDVIARAEAEGWGHVARAGGFGSIARIPLRSPAGPIGVIGVGFESNRIDDDDLSVLAGFTNQLADAIVRVRMDRERAAQLARLEEAHARQARLLDVIHDLSTPVIPVHDGILVVPLVGTIDSTRSNQIMDSLLSAVQREGASVVILDVTGVPMVDTSVANHLLQAMRAASLLGARCVLVGLSPVVARTIVQIDVDLGGVVTRGNLQAGIAYALELLRLRIRPLQGP